MVIDKISNGQAIWDVASGRKPTVTEDAVVRNRVVRLTLGVLFAVAAGVTVWWQFSRVPQQRAQQADPEPDAAPLAQKEPEPDPRTAPPPRVAEPLLEPDKWLIHPHPFIDPTDDAPELNEPEPVRGPGPYPSKALAVGHDGRVIAFTSDGRAGINTLPPAVTVWDTVAGRVIRQIDAIDAK